MKTIKILHLYYDLLNMYGESGNVMALVKSLKSQDVDVLVYFKSLNDPITLNDYDFIYIGAGTDEAYNLALDDMKKYVDDFKSFISQNKFILATGNALDLFSNLNILNFKSKRVDFRIIGEQIYYSEDIKKKVIGFQNRDMVINKTNEKSLFEVINGTGYEPNINIEGIHTKNFYGTYLLGPLLIRNPYLLANLTEKLLTNLNIKYKDVPKDIAYQAYEEFLKNSENKNE